ncbi:MULTISPECIES: NEL-type E3 ubiquitin ligase domain-containing protein [unclassified Undibacterium]|uniref:NEL-type E3 ubiquitin ligase domain-containing protein n=1 Tax=unclassified Undibacterium TaxID=2630295 RepID=UPI002AC99D1E|nr:MULTISPECIES: NEL-type E3 ubiquitin ligase domain-containing protein [unclassified Undibacterium]MEB0139305.1 NEL-type E3 ubiquitin ligase domain-containing protein [Undibacterium sp. CCC2.1]MEB0172149.1 NEL-type E3 ubiquitin ligase domain-containing protein [Undibacterium sp. CCC1.1]MEB0176060.1 NEL-type E3 ubiquitin ligase domain-containing protein [Undibacterium sp. CCC3.4]MEB0215372.1 NEL-type E3 ubiquitin ligase domain-containing protein [Undibacterium sp. 5I2]WPX43446.1 NEL-type E3 ub
MPFPILSELSRLFSFSLRSNAEHVPSNAMERAATWQAWANAAAAGSAEQRDIALARLLDCQQRELETLDLCELELRSLPPFLPEQLQRLEIADNLISKLPDDLPPTLRVLIASNNPLTALPKQLPPQLEHLEIADTHINTLPSNLPSTLRTLMLNYSPIQVLPEDLPSGLQILFVNGTLIRHLPDVLPAALRMLKVEYTLLRELPTPLPPELTHLDISHTRITRLPVQLPPLLELLRAGHTRLRRLPPLPPTLNYLDLSYTRITRLPSDFPSHLNILMVDHSPLLRLPDPLPPSLVYLSASHTRISELPSEWPVGLVYFYLPESLANSYEDTADVSEYSREQLHSMLCDLIEIWYPASQQVAAQTAWDALYTEDNAAAFIHFLHDLPRTMNSRLPSFREYMQTWLTQLTQSAALRSETFLLAHGATESCEDRLALTLAHMQHCQIKHAVLDGQYDAQLENLVLRGRELYRQEVLESFAHEKIIQQQRLSEADGMLPHEIDEIVIHLAYLVALRETLALNCIVQEMYFFSIAGLSQDDLAGAAAAVRQSENAGFAMWLANWEPWQSAMQRLDGAQHALAQENLSTHLEQHFDDLLEQSLQTLALDPDSAAYDNTRIRLGAEILQRERSRHNWAYTVEFMRRQNMHSLLAPAWPEQNQAAMPPPFIPPDGV